jgi:hypothetical protein
MFYFKDNFDSGIETVHAGFDTYTVFYDTKTVDLDVPEKAIVLATFWKKWETTYVIEKWQDWQILNDRWELFHYIDNITRWNS